MSRFIAGRSGAIALFDYAHFTILVLAVGFLAWTASRGLDITDEGMYLLTSLHPGDVAAALSSAHVYTAALFKLAGYDVSRFRLVGLLLTLVSAAIFARGTLLAASKIPVLQPVVEQPAVYTSFVCLGTTLIYGWTLRTPNYNVLTSFASTVFMGCLAWALATEKSEPRWILHLLAGLAVALCFFCKFPAALALVVVGGVMIVVWPNPSRLRGALTMLAGLVVGVLLHFSLFESFQRWLSTWREGLALWSAMDSGHGESPLVKSVRETLWPFARAGWKFLGLLSLLLALALLGFSRRVRDSIRGKPSLAFFAFVAIVFSAQSIRSEFFLGGDVYFRLNMVFYVAAALIVVLAVVAAAIVWDRPLLGGAGMFDIRLAVLIAVFAALPFCSAAGTGNPVYLNTLLAMAGWFALLALLFAMLSHITQCPLLFQAGTLLVGAFACSQIVTGYQVSPYRLAAPIFAQAIPTAIGTPQTNVRLDSRTSLFFESLRRAALASGLKPEDDVIAFFNMPGVVYALGARSPAAPWYHAGYPGSKRMNEMLVSMMPSDRLARAYILHKEGNAADFPDLTIVGVQFPQAYQVIAEATWPVTGERVRLWKPRAR